MNLYYEHHKRSWAKTVTYRLLIITSNGLILWLYTGRLDLTLGFISITSLVSTLIYFIHERVWNKIHWGRASRNM